MKRGFTLISVVVAVMLIIVLTGFVLTTSYNNHDRASIDESIIDLYSLSVDDEDSITKLNNYFREEKDRVRQLLSGEKIKIDGIDFVFDGNNIIGTVGSDVVVVYNIRIEEEQEKIIIYPQEKGYNI